MRNLIVVPASSTSIIRSLELTSLNISCVSFASERFSSLELLPAKALIMRARLLILLEAGSNDAFPFRTVVRLICIGEPNGFQILAGKLQFVRDFSLIC